MADYTRPHAYHRLCVPCEIPSPTLACEEAEALGSIPVVIFAEHYDNLPREVVQDNRKMPIEKNVLVGEGYQLSEDDFTGDKMYLGSPVGVY